MPRDETCVRARRFAACGCAVVGWRVRAIATRTSVSSVAADAAAFGLCRHAGAFCIGRFEELSANVYLPLPSEASLLFTFDLAVTVAHQEQVLAKESGLQALLTAFKDGYA